MRATPPPPPQVRRLPSASSLTTLKECLDYSSREWLDMFCRLDGAALLLQVIRTHEGPARWGGPGWRTRSAVMRREGCTARWGGGAVGQPVSLLARAQLKAVCRFERAGFEAGRMRRCSSRGGGKIITEL
jgi:hypothetical protein